MKAAVFHEAGKPLVIETIDDPKPQNGELIIQVKASGICGTDLHSAAGHGFPPAPGTVLGHEFAGEVVEVGPGVSSEWKKGDRLCALPFIGCGRCLACLSGKTLQCETMKIIGFDTPGSFAEYVRVHSNESIRLPDSVSWHEGALVEPLSVGLHGVRKANVIDGKNVLVIGAGPIGLTVALWCNFFGARQVIVSERDPNRARMALKFGATGVIDGSEEVGARFQQLTGGLPETIFECAGVGGLIAQCVEMAAFGAEIISLGVNMEPDTFVPVQALTKDITLKFSMGENRSDFQFIVDMLAARRIDVDAMVTDVVSLNELPTMIEKLHSPNGQCKVLVEPWR